MNEYSVPYMIDTKLKNLFRETFGVSHTQLKQKVKGDYKSYYMYAYKHGKDYLVIDVCHMYDLIKHFDLKDSVLYQQQYPNIERYFKSCYEPMEEGLPDFIKNDENKENTVKPLDVDMENNMSNNSTNTANKEYDAETFNVIFTLADALSKAMKVMSKATMKSKDITVDDKSVMMKVSFEKKGDADGEDTEMLSVISDLPYEYVSSMNELLEYIDTDEDYTFDSISKFKECDVNSNGHVFHLTVWFQMNR